MLKHQRVISILVFLVGFLLVYFVFWGIFAQTLASFREWRVAVGEQESLKRLVDSTPQFVKSFEDLSGKASPIFQAMPASFQEATYIVSLATIASKSGVIIKSMDIKAPDAKGTVALNLVMTGSITALERFLEMLQSVLPFFDPTQIVFGAKEGLQEFTLDMQSYIMPSSPSLQEGSFSARLALIENALGMNLDILKDDVFKKFKVSEGVPVRMPSQDVLGRTNPFAPF